MPTHADFLRAIIARPDDDLPRLIYADWLDDEGTDSERAEFIRVQCEIAADKGCRPYCVCPRCLHLFGRERELLDAHWLSWQPRCAHPLPRDSAVFRRGFVEEITVAWDDWQAHAKAIRAATPLRTVTLRTYPSFVIQRWDGWPSAWEQSLDADYPGIEFVLPSPLRWGPAAPLIGDPALADAFDRFDQSAGV